MNEGTIKNDITMCKCAHFGSTLHKKSTLINWLAASYKCQSLGKNRERLQFIQNTLGADLLGLQGTRQAPKQTTEKGRPWTTNWKEIQNGYTTWHWSRATNTETNHPGGLSLSVRNRHCTKHVKSFVEEPNQDHLKGRAGFIILKKAGFAILHV